MTDDAEKYSAGRRQCGNPRSTADMCNGFLGRNSWSAPTFKSVCGQRVSREKGGQTESGFLGSGLRGIRNMIVGLGKCVPMIPRQKDQI